MPRYKSSRIINNRSEFYKFLREKRGVKNIRHYNTPIMHNPTVAQRASLRTVSHVWSYGDRYYKLSSQYYGTPEYWWIIAWYNRAPTESHVNIGDVVYIPRPFEKIMQYLGV